MVPCSFIFCFFADCLSCCTSEIVLYLLLIFTFSKMITNIHNHTMTTFFHLKTSLQPLDTSTCTFAQNNDNNNNHDSQLMPQSQRTPKHEYVSEMGWRAYIQLSKIYVGSAFSICYQIRNFKEKSIYKIA